MSEGDAIGPALRRLLVEQIETVAQIEALLMLHKRRPVAQRALDVATELRIDPAGASQQLGALARRGLLMRLPDEFFALNEHDRGLMELLPQLEHLYATRRVTVITLVYTPKEVEPATPATTEESAAQQFADAFRLRRVDTGKQRDRPKSTPDQPGEKDG